VLASLELTRFNVIVGQTEVNKKAFPDTPETSHNVDAKK